MKQDYILPFFWQHGETEEKLREYMKIINESNISAVCIESRPHPDFCGEKWWKDMEIILDEARQRDMRVWILDDSHFPTGFANGAVQEAPLGLRRQSVYTYSKEIKGKSHIIIDLNKAGKNIRMPLLSKIMNNADAKESHFDDDEVLAVMITDKKNQLREIPVNQNGSKISIDLPEGAKKVHVTYLSRNFGIHRKYINMLDRESCKILIDAVYEPHYKHFKEDFGTTIAGFFSDEPEIGNGYYFSNEIRLGNNVDQPWSRELAEKLREHLGENYQSKLVLLWDNEADAKDREFVRYTYMDQVTRLVQKNFSEQIGIWCENHKVEYIGHMIEDNNQHSRTGASLGHYFRGLAGQHMAGIDDIGGQVLPHHEDDPATGISRFLVKRDGEFYHYMLGRMGASLAAIDPKKQGRCMCEIFGNYGWEEGPRLEKQLADHFMVRGVNRFVPHAFSPKEYPDKDCPPHFYANGHNPQYRAFGYVMKYMTRICKLISDGKAVIDTAIIYPGEMEWMGETMLGQKPARVLEEHQVPFHFLPCDVFEDKEYYHTNYTEGLWVNHNCYHTIMIPECRNITADLEKAIYRMTDSGCRVYFINSFPEKVIDTKDESNSHAYCNTGQSNVIKLEECYKAAYSDIKIKPGNKQVHVYHYQGKKEVYYLVNESETSYQGEICLPYAINYVRYDAWDNCYSVPDLIQNVSENETKIKMQIESGESVLILNESEVPVKEIVDITKLTVLKTRKKWEMALCRAIDYPAFKEWSVIDTFTDIGKQYKKFSGFIAYKNEFEVKDIRHCYIEIEDAGEDVEVFVNGSSCGIKVMRPFVFDVTAFIKKGVNHIQIEIATTLERERGKKNAAPIGILGKVKIYG